MPYTVNNGFEPESLSVQCLSIDKANFAHTNADSLNLHADCALGLVDLTSLNNAGELSGDESSSTTVTNFEKISIRCVACKPGYKAGSSTMNNYRIDLNVPSCTLIPHCEAGSLWFNYCSQCDKNYTYNYSEGIKFDECVSVPNNKSCYAYDNTN